MWILLIDYHSTDDLPGSVDHAHIRDCLSERVIVSESDARLRTTPSEKAPVPSISRLDRVSSADSGSDLHQLCPRVRGEP